jgi:hypothetical protein
MAGDEFSRLRQELDNLSQRLNEVEQRQRAAGSSLAK